MIEYDITNKSNEDFINDGIFEKSIDEIHNTVFIYKGQRINGKDCVFTFSKETKEQEISMLFHNIKKSIDNGVIINDEYFSDVYMKYGTMTEIDDEFIETRKIFGNFLFRYTINENKMFKTNYQNIEDSSAYSELVTLFRNNEKFHGRVPQIIKAMAFVCELYPVLITPQKIVDNFTIDKTRKLLNASYSHVETALLLATLTGQQIDAITSKNSKPDILRYVETQTIKKYKTGNPKYQNIIDWLCNHTQVSDDTYIYFSNYFLQLKYTPETSIDRMYAKISKHRAMGEIERIEEAYKKCDFKFKNCTCELKRTVSITGKYKAEILKAKDVRAVQLGYDTDCCQHLGSDGESSMMHGLINPKAGFWVLTNKNNHKVLAQAEVWEENENTLVFDNIEFANDADIDLYKKAIGKWLEESEYPTVKMGVGYNEMLLNHLDEFTEVAPVTPSVTPYEIYVISHEDGSEAPVFKSEKAAKKALDAGEVTYYDYIYCDSENSAVLMKNNGVLEPYFMNGQEKTQEQVQNEQAPHMVIGEVSEDEIARNSFEWYSSVISTIHANHDTAMNALLEQAHDTNITIQETEELFNSNNEPALENEDDLEIF